MPIIGAGRLRRARWSFFWPSRRRTAPREGQGLGRARVDSRARARRRSATAATPRACRSRSPTAAMLVLDAGTGIRSLGPGAARATSRPLHILLTHLHLDHIQGLMFFAPMFHPRDRDRRSGGRRRRRRRCEDRIARYISAPLSPVEVRELPCHVVVPRGRDDRVADRLGARSAPPRSPTAGRRSATGSRPTATSLVLHPRPRAGAGRAARRARGRVDLGLRPGARRRRC